MKKISFNDKFNFTKMVINGLKTQTRIIISPKLLDKVEKFKEEYYNSTLDALEGKELFEHYFFTEKLNKPPYLKEEVVSIAQDYKEIDDFYNQAYKRKHSTHENTLDMLDCVSNGDIQRWFEIRDKLRSDKGWKNHLFVKSDFMPHAIRITKLRIERIQDITDEECFNFGIIRELIKVDLKEPYYIYYFNESTRYYDTAKEAYIALINEIYGIEKVETNPYCFVIDFRLIR